MKRTLLFLLVMIFSCATFAQTQDWVWAYSPAGAGNDEGRGIATDANGNVYSVGLFQSSTLTCGTYVLNVSGSSDIFLVKQDPSGTVLWAKSFGGMLLDEGYAIATDAGNNVFITGTFGSPSITIGTTTLNSNGNNDIFVAKFDAAGTFQWAKSAGGIENDEGYGLATDASGDVYVTGMFGSPTIVFGITTLTNATPGGGNTDIFLVKYSSTGTIVWAKGFGGGDYDQGNATAVDNSGNVYITGFYGSTSIDLGGGPLTNYGSWDVFVAKYDASGNYVWSKKGGGAGTDKGNAMAIDGNDNIYVGGDFNSAKAAFGLDTATNNNGAEYDPFLVKYNSSGVEQWAASAGGSYIDKCNGVAIDANNDIYITGTFESSSIVFGTTTLTNVASADLYVTKYDPTGAVVWAKGVGGNDLDDSRGITTDPLGNIYLIGSYWSSSLTFGTTTLTNPGGGFDVWIAKINLYVGIDDISSFDNNILVYPDPFTSGAVMQLSKPLDNASLVIYNTMGQEVKRINTLNEKEIVLQRDDLKSGMYFFNITEKGVLMGNGKFIVE